MISLSENFRTILDPSASLEALARAFPKEWAEAQDTTKDLVKNGNVELIHERLVRAKATIDLWHQKLKSSRKPQTILPQALTQIARERLVLMALESLYRRALATKEPSTRGVFDQVIAQTLFFNRKRQRRSPSLRLFRCLWPFVRGKTTISAAIQKMGIYCVYSRDFGRALQRIVNGRSCLEIGAGDGTLTLLLESLGLPVHATDDYSWEKQIRYPAWIEKLSADQALNKYNPEVVLCSWPPPENSFEKHIFAAPSVKTYICIVSKHRFAAGNWKSYEEQQSFYWQADSQLTCLLLPPEWDHEVLVFQRKDV